jgi:hypothetical protein
VPAWHPPAQDHDAQQQGRDEQGRQVEDGQLVHEAALSSWKLRMRAAPGLPAIVGLYREYREKLSAIAVTAATVG